MPDAKTHQAAYLGADLSTTALSVGVRSTESHEDFVAVEMTGATRWHNQPAFHLEHLPAMLVVALDRLRQQGWEFDQPGCLSFSVRQHDMVLLNQQFEPLIPSLSWECHVAQQEVAELEKLGIDQIVGPIAPRFVLPKLLWTLRQQAGLANEIRHVATTGDFIAAQLTGSLVLSASDALSNALLDQSTKQVARDSLALASLNSDWFPDVVASGSILGQVSTFDTYSPHWDTVREQLQGWSVAAALGDNHASAVGCGLADAETIVISGGSSGTIVRACSAAAPLAGHANCFEFYDDRLLLMMLADCAIWYNRFLEERMAGNVDHASLNQAACCVNTDRLVRIRQYEEAGGFREEYPSNFVDLNQAEQVASVQFSIAMELLIRVQAMLAEVQDTEAKVNRFVLTGGLCQSPWIRWVLHTGLQQLVPSVNVRVSARQDKLAFQSATYGALVNAMVQGAYFNLPATIDNLCPQRACDEPSGEMATALAELISTQW